MHDSALVILGEDGRTLLDIQCDGTVTGDIERAGEAAEAFLRELRRQIAKETVWMGIAEAAYRHADHSRQHEKAMHDGD